MYNRFFKDIFATFVPKISITDEGSCYTAMLFRNYSEQNRMKYVKTAVTTPTVNGQVEKLNRTILSALMTITLEEEMWDEKVLEVQFAINNVINKSTEQRLVS